jgi:L-arabinonolactonase
MVEIQCVVDAKAALGEGTCWDPEAGVLWWIDIYGALIHRYNPRTWRDESWSAPERLGCLAVRDRGGLVLSMASGFSFFDPAQGVFSAIADPEQDSPRTRFNDGKTDREGRFWSGSMFEADGVPEPIGALYRLDPDLSVHKVIDRVGCSNGLAWSPDGLTMYFTDSHTSLVSAWDVDPRTGDIDNRRVFVDLTDEGFMVDGATVDQSGCYWMTVPLQGQIRCYDPAGILMRTVSLPVSVPTCCEFGGQQLDTLFVTSASFGSQADPLAGGLFAIDGLGATGLPAVPFRG